MHTHPKGRYKATHVILTSNHTFKFTLTKYISAMFIFYYPRHNI